MGGGTDAEVDHELKSGLSLVRLELASRGLRISSTPHRPFQLPPLPRRPYFPIE